MKVKYQQSMWIDERNIAPSLFLLFFIIFLNSDRYNVWQTFYNFRSLKGDFKKIELGALHCHVYSNNKIIIAMA